MRIAFTIILNGKHHLLHNDYYKFLINNFDKWIVVDGACGGGGTTGLNCFSMPLKYYDKNGGSIDGTREFLEEIKNEKTEVVFPIRMWESKEEQVNIALDIAKKFIGNNCFLWEIDIDEQWDLDSIKRSENDMCNCDAKTAEFLCDYYVGENLIAKGEWGEGELLPYRRLWKWEGEKFQTHEPPELECGNGKTILLPYRFNHYAYYFENDVKFKGEWYKGNCGVFNKWRFLKNRNDFPIHISELIGGTWGKTNTFIHRIGKNK